MIKTLISLLTLNLTFSLSLNATESSPWNNNGVAGICQKELLLFAATSGMDKENYRQSLGDRYDETVYRSLSEKIGSWSEVHLYEKKLPFIYKIDDEKMTKFSFDQSCALSTEQVKWPHHLEKALSIVMPEDWRNDDLKQLVAKNKKGVIYSWSPKFTYSVLVLPLMEKLAHEMGYEFTAVVDPRASKKEILASLKLLPKDSLKKYRMMASDKKFNRNVSIDLFMRSAFNHYPITFVYNNNKIHPRFVTGVMTDNGFKELVKTYATEL